MAGHLGETRVDPGMQLIRITNVCLNWWLGRAVKDDTEGVADAVLDDGEVRRSNREIKLERR